MTDNGRLDWATLAREELDRANEGEVMRESGLVIPAFTSGSHLRCWVKMFGEPAQTLVETPAQAMSRWFAFVNDPAQEVLIWHDHPYGLPIFVTRDAIGHMPQFASTFPANEQGRTTPGSIWAGQCDCARFGGPCPPRN